MFLLVDYLLRGEPSSNDLVLSQKAMGKEMYIAQGLLYWHVVLGKTDTR